MLVLLLLVLWPVAELFVAIKVAEAIGVLLTIVLLIASWPVGSWLLRSEGRAAWRRLSAATAAGRPPGRAVIDGALALVGGVLFLVPGFITDVLGAGLLLKPTRALARRLLERNLRSRLVVRATGFSGRASPSSDVDSTARDVDPRRLSEMSAGSALRTVAFGDLDGRVWGAAVHSGAAGLVFGSGDSAAGVPEPEWVVEDRAWGLSGDGYELHVEPRGEAPAAEAGGDSSDPEARGLQELCRVHGRISLAGSEQIVDCGGTRSVIHGLDTAALGSARVVSGWFGPDEAITLIALRARSAADHQADLIAATLFDPEGWVPVDDPRLSTTYTQTGEPARTSLELWVSDGENEFPRRAAGEAAGPSAGVSSGELRLRVAPLRCHSRGLEGAGVYVFASL